MPRILNIVAGAYGGGAESGEPVLRLAGALRSSGADVAVLLRGSAVNYVIKGQRIDEDVKRLGERGVVVYAVREDARDRGLDPGRIVGGIEFISRGDVPELFERFDQIW